MPAGEYGSSKGDRPICQLKDCRNWIPRKSLAHHAKYCTPAHARKAAGRRQAAKKKAVRDAALEVQGFTSNERERQGDTYRDLMARPDLVELLNRGEVAPLYVANLLGYTTGAVSRAMAAVRTTLKLEELKGEWKQSWKVRAMLPAWKLKRLREMGPEGEGTPEFENLLDELIRAYSVFSRYYFQLEGDRPIIMDFHLVWIRSIIVAFVTGGKQNIQSPPRHGKSEMLVRFCVWLIDMFPNIRIMWVAANADVAKLMLGSVKDHLTHNELLIKDSLPPGETFKPKREDSKPWSSKEVKVRQQSHVGQKSSSMIALGRTTKILSRDVDLLIVDDLEDFDSTREPSQREYSRNKFAEIGTRKEERTGWVNIGSRQHPDDIYSKLMALGGIEGQEQDASNPLAWRTIVNSAHNDDCQLDP